jgi:hypothetical protein
VSRVLLAAFHSASFLRTGSTTRTFRLSARQPDAPNDGSRCRGGGSPRHRARRPAGTARAADPEQLVVDLATDTGAFHGGASGSLYGVYGDGVPSRSLIE